MDQTETLFVYGTLRDDYDHPQAKFLKTSSKKIGMAVFRGRLYDTGHYSAVIPSDNKEDQVTGDLYRISNAASVFARLDSYEGYDPRYPERSLFVRKTAEVRQPGGAVQKAWIYLYNRPVGILIRIPEGDYIEYLKRKK